MGGTCGTLLGLLLWMSVVGHGTLGLLLCGAIGLGLGTFFGWFLSHAPGCRPVAAAAPAGAAPPINPTGTPGETLRELNRLHSEGILNDEEYQAKKLECLARL